VIVSNPPATTVEARQGLSSSFSSQSSMDPPNKELTIRSRAIAKRGTKRRKPTKQNRRGQGDSEEECIIVNRPNRQIRIDDTAALNDFYFTRFTELQQLHCKTVAKAWIKKIEPRKQTTHPYKNGDLAAPPWWPAGVKHKEPDHIKRGRKCWKASSVLR
jgi:hypothetical protein